MTRKPREYDNPENECSRCGRKFKHPVNLDTHLRYYDPVKGCVKLYQKQITEALDKELERLTNRNILLGCNGCLKKLTTGQVNKLKESGLVENKGYRTPRGFTDKGLQVWEELKHEIKSFLFCKEE